MYNLLEKNRNILIILMAHRLYVNAILISGHVGQPPSDKYYYYNTTNVTDTNRPSPLQRYQNCLYGNDIIECFKKETVIMVDDYTRNNEPWILNDYIQVNKNLGWHQKRLNQSARNVDSVDELLKSKILDLAESRLIQIKFPLLSSTPVLEKPHARQFNGNIEDFDGEGEDEGRKKKGKGGYLVGAMAIAAVLAQLALGKIAFLAGAAILIAKIALLLSLLAALKKQGGGTASGEHVVLAADHGHSSYNSGGWQRSIDDQAQDLAFRAQLPQPGTD